MLNTSATSSTTLLSGKRWSVGRKSIGVAAALLSAPSSASAGGDDDADSSSNVPLVIDSNRRTRGAVASGIRNIISRLVESENRFHPLDPQQQQQQQQQPVEEEVDSINAAAVGEGFAAVVGPLFENKENSEQQRHPSRRDSPSWNHNNMLLSPPHSARSSNKLSTQCSQDERVTSIADIGCFSIPPTPLGCASRTTTSSSKKATPRGSMAATVLTPRNVGITTTPRSTATTTTTTFVPTMSKPSINSTITPISEHAVRQQNHCNDHDGFPDRGPDSLLPVRTFSFEDAFKNENNDTLANSPCKAAAHKAEMTTANVLETTTTKPLDNDLFETETNGILPTGTFSFEEAFQNHRSHDNNSNIPTITTSTSARNSPPAVTTTTSMHEPEPEPEPVVSPRGDLGPLYLVPSLDTTDGGLTGSSTTQHPVQHYHHHHHHPEPEPVVSPKGESGPLYMMPTTQKSKGVFQSTPIHDNEDAWEWAYEIWRRRGLMPYKSKPPQLPFEATKTQSSLVLLSASRQIIVRGASASPPAGSQGSCSSPNRDDVSPSSHGSRRSRFVNVLQKWKDKSKDQPNSPFLLAAAPLETSATSPTQTQLFHPDDSLLVPEEEQFHPTTLVHPPNPITDQGGGEGIVTTTTSSSACDLALASRPSLQTQLSAYLSKYSPPRASSLAANSSRRRMRCSLDKSESKYNDGSEPFVRQASERFLMEKQGHPHRLLQDTPEHMTTVPPCQEIVVPNQEEEGEALNWSWRYNDDDDDDDGPCGRDSFDMNEISEWSQRDPPLLENSFATTSPSESDLERDGGGGGKVDFKRDGRRRLRQSLETRKNHSHRNLFGSGDCLVVEGREECHVTARNVNRWEGCNDEERDAIPASRELVPFEPSGWLDDVSHDEECLCRKAFIEGNDELVHFFLPRLDVGCTCGRTRAELDNEIDPTALENILRPWQCDFLKSFGIRKGDQLVKAHHRSVGFLAKGLKHWRIHQQGLSRVKTRSCVMALSIWSRSCKAFVRSIRMQVAAGRFPLQRPNVLRSLSEFLQQQDMDTVLYHKVQTVTTTTTSRQPQQRHHRRRRHRNSSQSRRTTTTTTTTRRKATFRPAIEAESQMEL